MKGFQHIGIWIVFFWLSFVDGWKHSKKLSKDSRKQISLGGYGFLEGGYLEVNLREYSVSNPLELDGPIEWLAYRSLYPQIGGILVKQKGKDSCPLDHPTIKDHLIRYPTMHLSLNQLSEEGYTYNVTMNSSQQGYWSYWIINCRKDAQISLDIEIEERNSEQNHLSAGDIPLLTLYRWLSLIYIGLVIFWIYTIFVRRSNVLWAHLLMLLFLLVKTLSVLVNVIEYSLMKKGSAYEAVVFWQFIGALLGGVVNVLLLAIISSGWFFVRSYLAARDKRIFLIAVVLQILVHTMRMIQIIVPSWIRLVSPTAGWIDFISYAAILIPIVQTKKRLRWAIQSDNRAAEAIRRYYLWSSFYVITAIYLYVTRFLVQILNASVNYRKTWLAEACYESASLLFFCFLGYRFRPLRDNPYFGLTGDVAIPMQSSSETVSSGLTPPLDMQIDSTPSEP